MKPIISPNIQTRMRFFGYVLAFALVWALSGPLLASAQVWGSAPYDCGAYWSSYPCSYEPYENYSYTPYYYYASPYYQYYYPYYYGYYGGYCPRGYYYNRYENLCYPSSYYRRYYATYHYPYYGPYSSYYPYQ